MTYLSSLNPEQKQAVECIEGPVIVIAGAGSGKTRVLTYRIAHMIHNKIDPFRILALTFTNKAAREMKERISKIVGNSDSKNIWMGTFHSVFARILRSEAEKIGYPSNFTIYDTDDSKSLIKSILSEQGLDDKVYKPGLVLNRISFAKNSLISPITYNNDNELLAEDRMSAKPKLGLIYEIYSRRCFNAGAMDFDDLLFKTNVLLRDHPDVLNKYQDKFKYILVDEYQDTNYSQYLIVKKLAARHENICVVGDDAQSIYAFRGATIQNILNFQNDYSDFKTFKLEQNYRSTKNIVNAANNIIAHNKLQLKKEVWTENPEGEKIKIFKAISDNEEGMIISQSIFDIKMQNQEKNNAFAILYRTNAQSRSLEEALRKIGIPYKIYGGLSFYRRKEIKDVIAYFRLTVNPKDEEALKRIINYPARGIGKTSVEKLIIAASEKNTSIWEIIENLESEHIGLGSSGAQKILDFATMIKSFRVKLKTEKAYELANHIAQSSGLLKELFTDKTPEGISRYDNIQELLNGIKEFSEAPIDENSEPANRNLEGFLEDIALLTDDKDEDPNDINKVSLMTIHAAKGLEFPYVYVAGMEENLFPSQLSLNSREEMEEERRLFYVAITRGEKGVFLSFASSRYKWGNLTYCEPSRFIDEIEPKFIEFVGKVSSNHKSTGEAFRKPISNAIQNAPKGPGIPAHFIKLKKNLNTSSVSGLQKGMGFEGDDTRDLLPEMEVIHEKFGSGKVMTMEGTFPNQKATVYFPGIGQKQLLLKFAKLKIIN